MSTIHPFEKSGLGQAPFRITGMIETVKIIPAGDGGNMKMPCGTCDFCGTGLRYSWIVADVNNKTFHVGCNCSQKADPTLMKEYRERSSQEEFESKFETELQIVEEATVLLEDIKVQAVLFAQPHPFASRAENGETLLDYVNFLMGCGIKAKAEGGSLVIEQDEATPKQVKTLKAHQRAGKAEAKAKQDFITKSEFQGVVGKRQDFVATVVKKLNGMGNYGGWTLTILRDENNNCLKYWNDINIKDTDKTNSNGLYQWAVVGDKVAFKATVKAHESEDRDQETYGQKQTVLSRAGKAVFVK